MACGFGPCICTLEGRCLSQQICLRISPCTPVMPAAGTLPIPLLRWDVRSLTGAVREGGRIDQWHSTGSLPLALRSYYTYYRGYTRQLATLQYNGSAPHVLFGPLNLQDIPLKLDADYDYGYSDEDESYWPPWNDYGSADNVEGAWLSVSPSSLRTLPLSLSAAGTGPQAGPRGLTLLIVMRAKPLQPLRDWEFSDGFHPMHSARILRQRQWIFAWSESADARNIVWLGRQVHTTPSRRKIENSLVVYAEQEDSQAFTEVESAATLVNGQLQVIVLRVTPALGISLYAHGAQQPLLEGGTSRGSKYANTQRGPYCYMGRSGLHENPMLLASLHELAVYQGALDDGAMAALYNDAVSRWRQAALGGAALPPRAASPPPAPLRPSPSPPALPAANGTSRLAAPWAAACMGL